MNRRRSLQSTLKPNGKAEPAEPYRTVRQPSRKSVTKRRCKSCSLYDQSGDGNSCWLS